MKDGPRFDWFRRRASSGSGAGGSGSAGSAKASGSPVSADEPRLTGTELEHAYRELLVQNMVLAESNERLQERLLRLQQGVEESPAARQLIQEQRDALVERSHRLRELEYQNQQLIRERKRLRDANHRLASALERQGRDLDPLRRQSENWRRELADTKASLREKANELQAVTERCRQLEALLPNALPKVSAANGEF